jgi:hypothetical protein
MPKGFFTQTICLLLSRPVSLDELEPLLTEFSGVRRVEGSGTPEIAGAGFALDFRREVNGQVVVDLQEERWPDDMGHPQEKPMLFSSWVMGHYGPFTFPGNLERAVQQAWTWKEAGAAVEQHRAFLRIKTTYVGGAGRDAKVMPADYKAEPELDFVIRVATALGRHPAVLAHFNPGGEVLLPPDEVVVRLADARRQNVPPLDVWTNVRIFNPGNGWMFMDSIGMEQVDVPDLEACYAKGAYDPGAVAGMLRNICLYRLQKGDVLQNGNTMDGAGGVRWRVFHAEESLAPRERAVLRWYPEDGAVPPVEMQPTLPKEEKKRGLFARVKGWFGRG